MTPPKRFSVSLAEHKNLDRLFRALVWILRPVLLPLINFTLLLYHPQRQTRSILLGLLGGIAVYVVGMILTGGNDWAVLAVGAQSKTTYMLLMAVPLSILGGLLMAGLPEELIFRGYIFQALGERLPVWVAGLVTSVLFGWTHIGYGPAQVVAAFVFSLVLIELRLVLGSLWCGIALHTGFDATYFYIVNVAGGRDRFSAGDSSGDVLNAVLWAIVLLVLVVLRWKKEHLIGWRKPLQAPTP